MRLRPDGSQGLLTVAKVLAENDRSVQAGGRRRAHALIRRSRPRHGRRMVVGTCLASGVVFGLTAISTTGAVPGFDSDSGDSGRGADATGASRSTQGSGGAVGTDAPPIAANPWTGIGGSAEVTPAAEPPPVVAGVPVVPAAAEASLPAQPTRTVAKPSISTNSTSTPEPLPPVIFVPPPPKPAATPPPPPADDGGLLGGIGDVLSPVTGTVAGLLGL